MKLLAVLLITSTCFCQTSFNLPENKKLFADYLFCTKDYVRAAEEYSQYLETIRDDTVEFKLALSLSAMQDFSGAEKIFEGVRKSSVFYKNILPERLKNCYFGKEYFKLRDIYSLSDDQDNPAAWKLRNYSYLYTETERVPSPPFLLIPFNERERNDMNLFYEKKINLPQKDPYMAGFLSAIIPGLGKLYTEEYGDAFFAALTNGIFGYLAYSNFRAHHNFRGYLFSAVTAWFYGGNIYGSAASAQIFNAKINFSFTSLLDGYLRNNNYFTDDYGFCR